MTRLEAIRAKVKRQREELPKLAAPTNYEIRNLEQREWVLDRLEESKRLITAMFADHCYHACPAEKWHGQIVHEATCQEACAWLNSLNEPEGS